MNWFRKYKIENDLLFKYSKSTEEIINSTINLDGIEEVPVPDVLPNRNISKKTEAVDSVVIDEDEMLFECPPPPITNVKSEKAEKDLNFDKKQYSNNFEIDRHTIEIEASFDDELPDEMFYEIPELSSSIKLSCNF